VLQAEKDHHVRDTYNYVTIQTDIKMPRHAAAVARDAARQVIPCWVLIQLDPVIQCTAMRTKETKFDSMCVLLGILGLAVHVNVQLSRHWLCCRARGRRPFRRRWRPLRRRTPTAKCSTLEPMQARDA
jgi:hypothetical protein